MAKLTFRSTDLTIAEVVESELGKSIFELASTRQIGIASACGGQGSCGLCRIKITEGEDQLVPYTEAETRHLGNLYHLTKLRLACQCVITDTSEDLGVEIKIRRKRS